MSRPWLCISVCSGVFRIYGASRQVLAKGQAGGGVQGAGIIWHTAHQNQLQIGSGQ